MAPAASQVRIHAFKKSYKKGVASSWIQALNLHISIEIHKISRNFEEKYEILVGIYQAFFMKKYENMPEIWQKPWKNTKIWRKTAENEAKKHEIVNIFMKFQIYDLVTFLREA